MKTKMFFGNQYIGKFNCSGNKYTTLQKIKMTIMTILKRLLVLSFVIGAIVGTYKLGASTTKPVTVFADKEVEVQVDSPSPVLDRIAMCESSDSQVNKQGQLLIHVNTNGTYDEGVFQINSNWDKEATKLGYDLGKEADNRAFAMYLYKNIGTGPWSSSSKCWNK